MLFCRRKYILIILIGLSLGGLILGHVGNRGSTNAPLSTLVFTAPAALLASFYCQLLNNLGIATHHQLLPFQWLVIITLTIFPFLNIPCILFSLLFLLFP